MFYLIIILVAAIIVLRTPKGKGALGEFKVNRTAKKYGILFKNYIIKDDMDFTHQIDTILVSSKGVFVIETKNYAGRIYGDDNSREWTQVLNYGKEKNRFYSPVKQNESHCYQVSKILPRNTQIYSYVVFTSNNTENIKSNSTIRLKDFNKIMGYYGDVLDEKQILNIVTLLEETSIVSI